MAVPDSGHVPGLVAWVPGMPKTKGSLTFRGGRYVEEAVAGSKRWRASVAHELTEVAASTGCPTWKDGSPVAVSLMFHLPVAPVRVRAGDLDKLTRNVLDAMQDAGLVADDVQVTRIWAEKVLMGPRGPGLDMIAWGVVAT